MISCLLEQRWSITLSLSHPQVTQRAKDFLYLKPEQYTLLEELRQALKPFERATVHLSEESYVTLCSLPTLIRGLMKSTQNTAFDNIHVHAFQAVAGEEFTISWGVEMAYKDAPPNISVIAAALNPRFCF